MTHSISRRRMLALGSAILSGSFMPTVGMASTDSTTTVSANLLYLCGGSGHRKARALLSNHLESVSRGHMFYEGSSPVFGPIMFKGQWYAACADCSNIEGLWRIHRSPDIRNLTIGEVVYQGRSPVTALLVYQDSLLVGFSHVGERDGISRMYQSAGRAASRKGPFIYEGVSPVVGMCEFKDQLYCGFSNVEGRPDLYRVHRAYDPLTVSKGEIVYEGLSPITCMVPTTGGLACGFAFCEARDLCRIHFSSDGRDLSTAPIIEEGRSRVLWGQQLDSRTFVAAFADCGGMKGRFRIHRHSSPEGIGRGEILYEGFNAPTAFVSLEATLSQTQLQEPPFPSHLLGDLGPVGDAGNAAAVCALARMGCMNATGQQSSQHCLAAAMVCSATGAGFLNKYWSRSKEPSSREGGSGNGGGGRGSAHNFEMPKYF